MYSDDAWSSCSNSEVHENNLGQNGFDINDEYIDDDLFSGNTDTQVPEPYPGTEEQYSPSELDHYFLDPVGLNLIDPFAIPQRLPNDDTHVGDPEPSPGPFDPG